MIVKNESACIEKCLESYLSSIDMIAIVDTGSSDNTIEIVNGFMRKNQLPGGIISKHWQYFAISRNDSIEYAIKEIRKYHGIPEEGPITLDEMNKVGDNWKLLFTDADNILLSDDDECENEHMALNTKYKPVNIKDFITEDSDHYMLWCSRSSRYLYRMMISIKANWTCGSKYLCHIHEFISTDSWNPKISIVNGVHCYSGTHGARGKDIKYLDDVGVLVKSIEKSLVSPTNIDRTIFYLAQSFYDLARTIHDGSSFYFNAYHYYIKRAELASGFYEERYISYVRASYILDMLPIFKTMLTESQLALMKVDLLHKAHQLAPARREALFDLMVYYDRNKQYITIWDIIKDHIDDNNSKRYTLFVNTDLYGHKFDEKAALIAYYAGDKISFMKLVERALKDPKIGEEDRNRILGHRKYYPS